MELNKRGMFFTVIAISLLSLFLVSFSIFSAVGEREAINKRIGTMNSFVFSLEEDLPRKLYISTFRIIFIHEKRIFEEGNYITDIDASFSEAFFEGEIEGKISDEEASLLSGVTFPDILYDINENAEKFNLKVNLSDPMINISHSDPWNVHVRMTVNLSVTDMANLASWNRTAVFENYIPVNRFEDPIYIINTNGKLGPKINQTPYSQFIIGGDPSNLLGHLDGGYYIATSDGPNFLMRLEGNLSADPQGVESLVHLPNVSAQGIVTKDKSIADHIYFSTSNPSTSGVSGMPSWFKLDSASLSHYII